MEIAGRLAAVEDGALAADIQHAMSGRRLGDDAPFDVTDDERVPVLAVVAESPGEERRTPTGWALARLPPSASVRREVQRAIT
ncbi:MAG: hypothetical protein M3Q71_21795 [Chloroflexota bacterium]|nr:hypothetical protein [Chloroflexota bacterium]